MQRRASGFVWRIVAALLLAGGALAAGPPAPSAGAAPVLQVVPVPGPGGTTLVITLLGGGDPNGTRYALRLTAADGRAVALPQPDAYTAVFGGGRYFTTSSRVAPALTTGNYTLDVVREAGGASVASAAFYYTGAPVDPQALVTPETWGYFTAPNGRYYVAFSWGLGLRARGKYFAVLRGVESGRKYLYNGTLGASFDANEDGVARADLLDVLGSPGAPTPGRYVLDWVDAFNYEGPAEATSAPFTLTDQPIEGLPTSPSPMPSPAPTPVPSGPPPAGGDLCFPGFTAYCVSGLFRQQWEAKGQLAINGYPLTGEIQETLPNERGVPTVYTVQYFERVRMERHTDAKAGQPVVLLGQFGRALHPAEPRVPRLPGAVYFDDTGHNVARPEFAAFWATRGDLAQFGFPLGEEQDETLPNAKGEPTVYRVQYFERARLEWHPDNAPGQQVQLGQFGRAVCAERCR